MYLNEGKWGRVDFVSMTIWPWFLLISSEFTEELLGKWTPVRCLKTPNKSSICISPPELEAYLTKSG